MKKQDKDECFEAYDACACDYCHSTCDNEKQEKSDFGDKAYKFLDAAEKLAVKLALINQVLKEHKRKNLKKSKKIGKIDKHSGTIILKKSEKHKLAKLYKKYSPPKKK